jgi:hypothetical protein
MRVRAVLIAPSWPLRIHPLTVSPLTRKNRAASATVMPFFGRASSKVTSTGSLGLTMPHPLS